MNNIIIDENIAFAEEAFSKFGNVKLMHGREIDNDALKSASVLIIRSITKVNETLLKDTSIKFLGTATIGTDHIDLEYLKSHEIAFADAKGCNADAVAEYIFTALLKLTNRENYSLMGKTIGVVGAGNIGSLIVKLAKALGMNVLINDPPLERKFGRKIFVPLEEIYNSDIITLHVPLNKDGLDKTVHLFDYENIGKIKNEAIFINASRGQVVNNKALLDIIPKKNLSVVLDVWENEPGINIELLKRVNIGTPHIAGYSLEGKVNGTLMIYNALCKFLGETPSWKPVLPAVESPEINIKQSGSLELKLNEMFKSIYNIQKDDEKIREMINIPGDEAGRYFDSLRKNYPLRREFSNYKIKLNNNKKSLETILRPFRFTIEK
jgi:erythronate-4-phosphate dehydrogenase